MDFGDAAAVADALASEPAIVWLETPSNPLLRITDIRAVAAAAHAAGALVVADNTFLSPALQQPIELGADIVVHSTTKYINGHSDVVGGAVIAGTAALHEQLTWWANVLGLTGSPFDSYLTLRGLRTLHARLRVHLENTEALVRSLVQHPAVAAVHCPGLPDHPGHQIALSQQHGFGAILSVELVGGMPAVKAFVEGLTCFTLAESLGGVESLVAHPATMTHARCRRRRVPWPGSPTACCASRSASRTRPTWSPTCARRSTGRCRGEGGQARQRAPAAAPHRRANRCGHRPARAGARLGQRPARSCSASPTSSAPTATWSRIACRSRGALRWSPAGAGGASLAPTAPIRSSSRARAVG